MNMITEISKRVLNEGVLDRVKSGLWKAKNLPKVNPFKKSEDIFVQQNIRDNKRPYNPHTYNKNNFHSDTPEYGSKEFNKMFNSDDGWVMGVIQRDIRNMKSYLNGETSYEDSILQLMGGDNDSISLAKKYGLDKYAEYLNRLYKEVIQKHKSEVSGN